MTTYQAPSTLQDNGFLYMLTTVAIEVILIGVIVWLVRLLVSRIEESDRVTGDHNVYEAVWCELPEHAQRLRNQMLRHRGIRLPGNPAKVAEFERVIRVNRLERTIRL